MSEWHDWGMSQRHEQRKAEARIKGPHAAPRTRCRERREKNTKRSRRTAPAAAAAAKAGNVRSATPLFSAPQEGRRPPRMAHTGPVLSSAVLCKPQDAGGRYGRGPRNARLTGRLCGIDDGSINRERQGGRRGSIHLQRLSSSSRLMSETQCGGGAATRSEKQATVCGAMRVVCRR